MVKYSYIRPAMNGKSNRPETDRERMPPAESVRRGVAVKVRPGAGK